MDRTILQGKTAVVTGANRGIGRAITECFHEKGATVIACMRDIHACDDLDSAIYKVALDLSSSSSISSAARDIRSISKEIDILINCAGVATGAIAQMTTSSQLQEVFNINVFATVDFTQKIFRLMARKEGDRSIINISSSANYHIQAGTLCYGASKAALERITKSMALEFGQYGVRVNTVSPGVTDTDMAKQMDRAAYENLVNSSILKVPAKPEQIADCVLFLSSDLASHITGQTINVDGGLI